MTGNVSNEELSAALSLGDHIKARIMDYEKKNWAANLSASAVKAEWSDFLSKLESSIKNNTINDEYLLSLINYLSTIDSVSLLEKIKQLDLNRQERFLQLLNWVAKKSPDQSQRENASQVCERILMAYRMEMYPEVYSAERISRAIQIIQSSLNKET
jgi:hypothetical protein